MPFVGCAMLQTREEAVKPLTHRVREKIIALSFERDAPASEGELIQLHRE